MHAVSGPNGSIHAVFCVCSRRSSTVVFSLPPSLSLCDIRIRTCKSRAICWDWLSKKVWTRKFCAWQFPPIQPRMHISLSWALGIRRNTWILTYFWHVSYFLGWRISNLITGLSGSSASYYLLRTQETVPGCFRPMMTNPQWEKMVQWSRSILCVFCHFALIMVAFIITLEGIL